MSDTFSRSPQENMIEFDVNSLSYPSDSICIGTARRVRPSVWDDVSPLESPLATKHLVEIVQCERMLAHNAFALAAGNTVPFPDLAFGKEMIVEKLSLLHQKYGVSSGLSHTRELVRDIENAAATQASQKLGRFR